jgi:hypothetical protein
MAIAVVAVMFVGATNSSVSVDPIFGRHVGAVTVTMTPAEARIVARMSALVRNFETFSPSTNQVIDWRIESSALASRTFRLSRSIFVALQQILERQGWTGISRTVVVIARTQSYINAQLASVDCYPNLVRTGGVHLMGETVCGRRVIVINLTGYFFLRAASDVLDNWMEIRAEPGFSRVDYRLVDRNISGLAHEWAHVARAAAEGGATPDDEPAWFREGFAEMMAGVARVAALSDRMSYLDFHVIRLRKFADWARTCRNPLRDYRTTSDYLGGCEYYVGPLAVELLLARFGGLSPMFRMFANVGNARNFAQGFRNAYGFDLAAFETIADRYINGIRNVSTNVS